MDWYIVQAGIRPAPEGMVWIPGGGFSMGAADPPGLDRNGVGMHATDDSRPIHRVWVIRLAISKGYS